MHAQHYVLQWRLQRKKRAVDAELAAAELVAEGITAEVEFGQKIFLDQLDAEQSVSDAKVRQLQAQQSIMTNHFRLLAAIGQLDANAIGLADELSPIQEAESPRDIFTGFLPLADLPE
jgi:outer membrane protein TolC